MKTLLYSLIIIVTIIGCDIRKKDTTAQQKSVNNTDNNEAQQNFKDSTTVLELDSVYNFGTVPEGTVVQYKFRFKNTGSNPLILNNPQVSCGCTVADKPEAPIKPGETSFINVSFNSKGREGKVYKTITVTSNARPDFKPFIIEGTVTKD